MTTIDAFRESVTGISPPDGARPALQGLWWAAKGDWDQAHKCVQGHEDDAECNWVHAHLHHQEGDMSNAANIARNGRCQNRIRMVRPPRSQSCSHW